MNTQQARVLAALRIRGAHGICQTDFLLPDVVDGGSPITRMPARVKELRDQGFDIRNAGRRDKCRVFRLFEAAREPYRTPPPASVEPTLFTPPPRLAIFDEDAA